MSLSFGDKVGKLEEAIVDLLFAGMPYVSTVSTYNGELSDRPKLIEALKTLKGMLPLVLVAYTGGTDEEVAGSPVPNAPVEIIHHATIEVVYCADDSRAQYKRVRAGDSLTRKGNQALTHRMFSDGRAILSGRQLTIEADGDTQILNEGELTPVANDYIERMPALTAVSTPFTLSFRYTSPDHREPYGGEITTINFDIGRIGDDGRNLEHPPGVFPRFNR